MDLVIYSHVIPVKRLYGETRDIFNNIARPARYVVVTRKCTQLGGEVVKTVSLAYQMFSDNNSTVSSKWRFSTNGVRPLLVRALWLVDFHVVLCLNMKWTCRKFWKNLLAIAKPDSFTETLWETLFYPTTISFWTSKDDILYLNVVQIVVFGCSVELCEFCEYRWCKIIVLRTNATWRTCHVWFYKWDKTHLPDPHFGSGMSIIVNSSF